LAIGRLSRLGVGLPQANRPSAADSRILFLSTALLFPQLIPLLLFFLATSSSSSSFSLHLVAGRPPEVDKFWESRRN
jgi:hypothetical protein